MEEYLEIGRVNLKYNLLPHLIIAFLFSLAVPLFMGVEGLDASRTAQVLESFVVLTGVILLIPIFLPDQDKNIRDLVESKYISMGKVHLVRLVEAVVVLTILVGAFVTGLYYLNPVFPQGIFFFGAMADALFLGGIGILAYSLWDHIAVAYMIPMVYYVMNYGGEKYLKKFYLFSMMQGRYEEKIYMGITGVLCIVIGLLWRRRKG